MSDTKNCFLASHSVIQALLMQIPFCQKSCVLNVRYFSQKGCLYMEWQIWGKPSMPVQLKAFWASSRRPAFSHSSHLSHTPHLLDGLASVWMGKNVSAEQLELVNLQACPRVCPLLPPHHQAPCWPPARRAAQLRPSSLKRSHCCQCWS